MPEMAEKLDCFGRIHQELMGELSRRDQIRLFAKEMSDGYERRSQSKRLKITKSLPGLSAALQKPMRRFYVQGNESQKSQKHRAITAPGRIRSKQKKETVLPEVAGAEAENPEEPERPTLDQGQQAAKSVRDSRESAKMAWIARANHVPVDTCLQAADLFLEQVNALEKNLNLEQFGKCLLHCTGMEKLEDLPPDLLRHAFAVADKDKNGTISFPEFVTWFSTAGFNTNVTLSPKERAFREFCAENNLSLVDMDRYQKYFAEYDCDGSGEIDYEEFEGVIRRCARVPRHLEIPPARMKQLWTQADNDCSGSIDFEEFALFYRKFFEAPGAAGFESFYRNVRPPLGKIVG